MVVLTRRRCHSRTSCETSLWMHKNIIATLNWPAKFLDVNIIENVCGVAARQVYSDHQDYDAIDDTRAMMKDVWESFSIEYLQKLYRSLPRRLLAVIDVEGGDT